MIDGDDQLAELAALLAADRFEEAERLVPRVGDVAGLADLLLETDARVEFRDVDVSLVRLLEDVLAQVSDDDLVRSARLRAKLAFELRGDPTTLARRRELLRRAAADATTTTGDDVAVTDVLLAQVLALWEPGGAADRLAAAEKAIESARRARDLDRELQARVARIDALVTVGKVQDAELELRTYANLAQPTGRADLNTFVASRRGMLAMLHGRIDDVVRFGEEAYRHAVAAGMRDAERLRMVYLSTAARERSGPEADAVMKAGATMLLEQATRLPGQYFEADAAWCLLVTGRLDEARVELSRAMPALLTSRDYRWQVAACNAALVAAEVGTERECGQLYEALLPYEACFVSTGPGFWGSTRHRLGVLALRLGRTADAVGHLRHAVHELEAIAAPSWAVHTRVDLARALRATGDLVGAREELALARQTAQVLGMTRLLETLDARPAAGDAWSLGRDGDDWLLDAGAERARLRGGRGFDHLAVLLANPGRDIPALELDAGPDTPLPGPGIEVLDDQAMAAYRRRLATIESELDGADQRGDAAAAARLHDEREQLLAQLRSATGLGGRTRRTSDVSERARVNVTRNLRRALDQISRAAPIAGAHLTASIRTGTACRYEPAPGGPDRWQV